MLLVSVSFLEPSYTIRISGRLFAIFKFIHLPLFSLIAIAIADVTTLTSFVINETVYIRFLFLGDIRYRAGLKLFPKDLSYSSFQFQFLPPLKTPAFISLLMKRLASGKR